MENKKIVESFDEFHKLNEAKENTLELIRVYSPVDDSRANASGTSQRLSNDEIISLLKNPDDISDDEVFHIKTSGKETKKMSIDQLEGKTLSFKDKKYSI
jgi:uncharacterized protein YdcH (DUF465 family)